MRQHPEPADGQTATLVSCWNTIGVRGDRSCPELDVHVHCRNCPVHSNAAAALLDRPVEAAFALDRTEHFAKPKPADQRATQSMVVFRIGPEWFALATPAVAEVAERRVVHSVPHRRAGIVLGVVNVRGELLVCVSLGRLLGLEESGDPASASPRSGRGRFLVIHRNGMRAVMPVDEVFGVQRVHADALRDAPTTVSKAAASHSKAVVSWQEHVVGLLDDEKLFHTLQRSLA
jgi:chemotaxis-related protein WspD